MDVIAELERVVAERDEERRVAELGHAGAAAALRKVREAREASARRRGELANAIVAEETLLEAAGSRLGEVRAEAARTAREIELRADRVADGDEKAAATVVRLQDTAQMQQALIGAHERKVRELEERVAAEVALAEHDKEQEGSAGRELERLLAVEAAGVDQLLGRVAGRAGVLFELVDARRAGGVRESWPHPLQHAAGRLEGLKRAFASAVRHLEPQHARLGTSTPVVTVAGAVHDAVGSWSAGSGRSAPSVEGEAA